MDCLSCLAVIAKILSHRGLPTEPPAAHPARPSPDPWKGRPAGRPYVFVELDEPIDEPAFDC